MKQQNENVIEVTDLVKRYSKSAEPAVDHISFSVTDGEFFAFLGPNGAGKTTTISILTTTMSATSGSVHIAGLDLAREASKVCVNIGIIFQHPSLDTKLTAEENIRFHACLYGLYPYRPAFRLMPAEYCSRVLELAEVVGLRGALFKPIGKLSGGMQRKLEIIRSLIHTPKVLFLDEPTQGLDALSRRNLWEYIDKVRRETNTTVFLTTHYIDEAEGADTVCLIDKGKIALCCPPAEMKQRLGAATLEDAYVDFLRKGELWPSESKDEWMADAQRSNSDASKSAGRNDSADDSRSAGRTDSAHLLDSLVDLTSAALEEKPTSLRQRGWVA